MHFICNDPAAPEYVAAEDNIMEWVADMEARGVARHGDRLRPVEDATTVTVRAGEVVVHDGPFAETARITATLIRVTGDWSLAEDCVQDAFARAG